MSDANYYKKAFTLIELLVALGMALIVVSSAISLTILIKRQITQGSNKLEVVQNARSLTDRLTRDLRQAKVIVTVLSEHEGDDANDPVSEIEFENGHGGDQINYIKYYQSGNDIVRQNHHYSFSSDPEIWVTWDTRDNQNRLPTLVIDGSAVVANYIESLDIWKNGDFLIYFEVEANKNNERSRMRTQVFSRNLQSVVP